MDADRRHDPGPLTRRLRRLDPTWWWLRENFKLPSLGAIGALVLSAGGWIWSQHMALEHLAGKLEGLATAAQVQELAGKLEVLRSQGDDQDERLGRLEQQWDRVTRVADEPIPLGRHRRPCQTPGCRGVR